MAGRLQPVLAGWSRLVGFASSFTVVLAGLQAVGATDAQAASGLLALCLASALAADWLALRYRMPIAVAWSTPGAALLVATGPVAGGWPVAVGAFLVCRPADRAAGLVPWLGRAVAAIPGRWPARCSPGCSCRCVPRRSGRSSSCPLLAGPVVLAWLLLHRFARPLGGARRAGGGGRGDRVDRRRPAAWRGAACARRRADRARVARCRRWSGWPLPLFLVTMAAQNVPGMAVLAGYGYRPPLRGVLRATGLVSAAAAPFGGHAVNLAAITAALAAGPDAHPDPAPPLDRLGDRRRRAAVLGLGAGAGHRARRCSSPPILVEAVAGLALLRRAGRALAAAVDRTGRGGRRPWSPSW